MFKNKHTILPVIHVDYAKQAIRNTKIARDAGCDGVFLINHRIDYNQLLSAHLEVKKEFPDFWVGVNCLDLTPTKVFDKLNVSVDGVWVDNAEIDETNTQTQGQPTAKLIKKAREFSGWKGHYFGGVAFKGQRAVDTDLLGAAASNATHYMDFITTSGPRTAAAASVEKIAKLKQGIWTHTNTKLAVASGITPENVTDYLEVADCFLVASGIACAWTELDPTKVSALVDKVRNV